MLNIILTVFLTGIGAADKLNSVIVIFKNILYLRLNVCYFVTLLVIYGVKVFKCLNYFSLPPSRLVQATGPAGPVRLQISESRNLREDSKEGDQPGI
jgi:hypothetical protein